MNDLTQPIPAEEAEALAEAQALREEIIKTAAQTAPPKKTEPSPPQDKAPGAAWRTAFRLMTALTLMLLVFFIGMRWIEHASDKKIAYYAGDDAPRLTPAEVPEENRPQEAVNINTASVADLMTLPGIGEVKAQQIVDYRNEYGPFTDLSELMNIRGIGESTLKKLTPYITLGDAAPTPEPTD